MDSNSSSNTLSVIPIGGVGTVTKNMYLYQYKNEILIVDCGIGFPDPSTPGVDFLIPDVTYLKKAVATGKKIVGLLLTHGHEDHIGGVPFVLDQLPEFPMYTTSLTAAFLNEKLKDFGLDARAQAMPFKKEFTLGAFTLKFLHVTHSVLDTSHIVIKCPVGTIYHGSDFKFDLTPFDGHTSDLHAMAWTGEEGVLCLLSDCLGAERQGHSKSEVNISDSFEAEFRKAKGRVYISTFSSNISRMNQAIEVALKFNRKICLMGRSFIKARDIGRQLKYMNLPPNMEVKPQQVMRMDPQKVMILLPGSQAQEESALVRVANGNHRDLRIEKADTVIFSADPIPGNELNINVLIDTISQRGARVVHSDTSDAFHVSGHGSQNDLKLLMGLTKPQFMLPIGGNYRHMIAYRELAKEMGYNEKDVILPENGQEIIFNESGYRFGIKIPLSTVYVDQVTGEEMEKFILLDRQKIASEGIMIIITEIESATGKIVSTPDIIARGFSFPEKDVFAKNLESSLRDVLNNEKGKPAGFAYYRKMIQRKAEDLLYREKREPLVIPVIIEI